MQVLLFTILDNAFYACMYATCTYQISLQLSATTIETNPTVLNLCTKDLDLEVDPFFQQMFALFDEGHEEGFMLCQLITRYVLVLNMYMHIHLG